MSLKKKEPQLEKGDSKLEINRVPSPIVLCLKSVGKCSNKNLFSLSTDSMWKGENFFNLLLTNQTIVLRIDPSRQGWLSDNYDHHTGLIPIRVLTVGIHLFVVGFCSRSKDDDKKISDRIDDGFPLLMSYLVQGWTYPFGRRVAGRFSTHNVSPSTLFLRL